MGAVLNDSPANYQSRNLAYPQTVRVSAVLRQSVNEKNL